MEEGKTVVSVLIKKNEAHLMSTSPEHQSISEYFVSDEFVEYAGNHEVDAGMLVKISEGLSNFIRNHHELNMTNALATCTNAKVGQIDGTEDMAVLFCVDIKTDVEV